MKLKTTLAFLVTVMCAATAQNALAQAEVNGPTALITTYRAKPGTRVKFRSIMQGEGVAQFEQWKKAGVFAVTKLCLPRTRATACQICF